MLAHAVHLQVKAYVMGTDMGKSSNSDLMLSRATGHKQSQLPLDLKSGLDSHGDVFFLGRGTCGQPQPGWDLVAERSRLILLVEMQHFLSYPLHRTTLHLLSLLLNLALNPIFLEQQKI